MRLKFQEQSELKFVSRIISEAKRSGVMRPKLWEQSELELAGRNEIPIPEAKRNGIG